MNRRTKDLVKTLRRGEVAVIRHNDLDSVAARALVACRPAFVVNAGDSITGRYPNSGPSLLLEAGIPILDRIGEEAFEAIREGDSLRLDGDTLYRKGEALAQGRRLMQEIVKEQLESGRRNVVHELRGFAENTLRHLSEEAEGLLEPAAVPDVRTPIAGRHVVIVVRGEGFENDLTRVLSYIQEQRPVLIGVDGGADALLEIGLRPDLILGDMDSVSDRALRCGAELIVHAYRDGRAPGLERVKSLGRDAHLFPVPGTSEDAAMLLAYERGAEMIVAVGTHFSLVDFLDKGRAGMSSTFLVRLKVGSILVDAKGVSRLYRPRVRGKEIVSLMLAGAVPLLAIFILSPSLNNWTKILFLRLKLFFWNLF
ncbi:MAG: hypothetical protein KY468_08840 [Armatimonadetes bacterium]|nr:hypothetical protein [Armatimonadota bacterium]